MDGSAIKELERITKESVIVEKDGLTFSPLTMKPIIYDPEIKPLVVHRLKSLVDYIKSDESQEISLILIHDPKNVAAHTSLNAHNRRDCLIRATVDLDEFPFGVYLPIEDFIIKLRTMFCDDDDTKNDYGAILKYVSKISNVNRLEIEDDGITQKVAISTGVSGAVVAKQDAPSNVYLSPYRTFRDIAQPKGSFLFRVRKTDEGPKAALFEADGGYWRIAAIESIEEYLKAEIDDIPILS